MVATKLYLLLLLTLLRWVNENGLNKEGQIEFWEAEKCQQVGNCPYFRCGLFVKVENVSQITRILMNDPVRTPVSCGPQNLFTDWLHAASATESVSATTYIPDKPSSSLCIFGADSCDLQSQTLVHSVTRSEGNYIIRTTRGVVRAKTVFSLSLCLCLRCPSSAQIDAGDLRHERILCAAQTRTQGHHCSGSRAGRRHFTTFDRLSGQPRYTPERRVHDSTTERQESHFRWNEVFLLM